MADGSVGNKVVVTDDVNRSESVEGKTFLSRWKRPRGSSPRKKDRARATVLAATRVLNVRGAHRFSDSAQVLVGEHFIELSNENEGGRVLPPLSVGDVYALCANIAETLRPLKLV